MLSLQTAQTLRCHFCGPLVIKIRYLEDKLKKIQKERMDDDKELTQMR